MAFKRCVMPSAFTAQILCATGMAAAAAASFAGAPASFEERARRKSVVIQCKRHVSPLRLPAGRRSLYTARQHSDCEECTRTGNKVTPTDTQEGSVPHRDRPARIPWSVGVRSLLIPN
eukprot:3620060-Prymnesium_polylepis.1